MLASVDCFVRFMHGEAVEQKTLVILSWCSSSTYVACTSRVCNFGACTDTLTLHFYIITLKPSAW